MNWIPFVYVLLAVIVSVVWMGLALGAVFTKMGMESSRAWIPVLRWVAAAEAGRTSRLAVMIARSVSALGVTILLFSLAIRGVQGGAGTALVGWLIIAGSVLFALGALTGWIFWIIGAGTIGMRLNLSSGWVVLAALSPNWWAAIVGWFKIGTPIPSDAIGRAASAGASPQAPADAPEPLASAVATGAASVFGHGTPAPQPAHQGLDMKPFNNAPVDAVAHPAPAARPAVAPGAAGPVASSAPTAPFTSPPPVTPGAPENSAAQQPEAPEAVSPAPSREADPASSEPAPAETSAAVPPVTPASPAVSPYISAPKAAPAVDRPSYASPPPPSAPPLDTPTLDRPAFTSQPPAEAPRPVSPYDSPAAAPVPEDDVTVIEKLDAPADGEPVATPVTPASSSAASAQEGSVDIADSRISMLPPGWSGAPSDATGAPAAAEPTTANPEPLEPAPQAARQDQLPAANPVADSAESSPEFGEAPSALSPTPPPTRPAPTGVWAAPAAGSAVPVVPEFAPAPTAPPASASLGSAADTAPEVDDDAADDHTVIAQRRRDVWVLEVVGGDSYPLPDSELTIGRAAATAPEGAHLGIDDTTRTMSKRHASLRLTDGVWKVSDLGSTNGTFVRDAGGREVEVMPGSEANVDGVLLLGDLEARIENKGSGRG